MASGGRITLPRITGHVGSNGRLVYCVTESINQRKQQRHCGIDIQSPLHKELIITAAAEPPTATSGSARRNKGRRSHNKRTITSPIPHKVFTEYIH